MTIKSKTRGLSRLASRYANSIEYIPGNGLQLSNKAPIGAATTEQTLHGNRYASVQGAIDDLVSLTEYPINTVVINTDNISPSAISQVQLLTVELEGEVSAKVGDILTVFGLPIVLQDGDWNTTATVANRILTELKKYADNSQYFEKVAIKATTTDQIEVTMIDYKVHSDFVIDAFGIKVSVTQSSPAKPGLIGSWDNIGNENKFSQTLYYWKRVA